MTTNSALAPPRDGIRRGQPRGCLVRPPGVSANTPCGNTQASSPSDTGARSRSSCESRCVTPSAGTGHPLLHRVGGRRPPSLSLVLKCEREPGTPVIPASKRRAKGGPLRRAEQCGANHAASGPCVEDRLSGRSSLVGTRVGWVCTASKGKGPSPVPERMCTGLRRTGQET